MNYAPLMQATIDSAIFFGLSGEDIIQSDAAVAQLEGLASTLQKMSETDRQEFLLYVQHLARKEELENGKTMRVEFLSVLGENLGLC